MKAQTLRDRLSQWEAHLAPLSSRQKDGYLQLSTAATSRPLPPQLAQSQVTLDVSVWCNRLFLNGDLKNMNFPKANSRPSLIQTRTRGINPCLYLTHILNVIKVESESRGHISEGLL